MGNLKRRYVMQELENYTKEKLTINLLSKDAKLNAFQLSCSCGFSGKRQGFRHRGAELYVEKAIRKGTQAEALNHFTRTT